MKPFRRMLALAALAGICATAQNPAAPPRGTSAPPRRAAPASAAGSGAAPSVKDLEFPPLKTIRIPDVASFTLANGMKVYLLAERGLPQISGLARVRTGDLFDPAGKAGLAELTGMVMRAGGAKGKTGDQWSEELEDVAGSVESRIEESSGTVSFSALTESAGPVMAVFKDAIAAPEFPQDTIDFAKAQIRGVIAHRNDNAQGIAQREFSSLAFGKDTPYGQPEEYSTIARITRSDLQEFHRRYFFPKNILLAVWGDFDTAAMKTRLERLFADWTVEQPAVPPFPPVRAKADPGVYLAVKKDAAQTYFAVGGLGGEMRDPDYPALEVMAAILGGGFQSRLFQRVRTKMDAADEIGAAWSADYGHAGLFEVSGSAKSISTADAIQAIRDEAASIRSAEVSDEELRSGKDAALSALAFAFDSRAKTLARMLDYEYFGYPADFTERYQKALAAVTRADVLRVARQHLDPAGFITVVVGNPTSFGKPLESLGGPVRQIDLTIPSPEAAPADAASVARGRQLLERAQGAAGGAAKLAAIRDYTETSELQTDSTSDAARVRMTDRWLAPGAFRRDQLAATGRASVFLNEGSGWIASARGTGVLTGASLQEVQGSQFRLYFRILLADRMAGWTVNAIDDATVEITDGGGQIARLLFDPATGMARSVRYESQPSGGAPVALEDVWSDFRETGGVRIPYKTTLMRNGMKFADVIVTDCKFNSGLKPEEIQARP